MKELIKELRAIREVLEEDLFATDPDPVEGMPYTLRGALARANRRPKPYRPMCEAMPAMFEPPLPPLPKEKRRYDDEDESEWDDVVLRRRSRR
jgi:hypothetical protein